MNPIFFPRLINGPFDDPCLFVDFKWERRALLFDLGRLDNLSPRQILRISDTFISHTHIDHFVGFDTLLRISLGREDRLRLYGPEGFISNVEGKLKGYTWNLIEDYPISMEVIEVGAERLRKAEFNAKEGFRRMDTETIPYKRVLIDEPTFWVETVLLDHRTPSLAFSINEKEHINIKKEALDEMGIAVGPWLRDLKSRVLECAPDDTEIIAPLNDGEESIFKLGELKERAITVTDGMKITYITDASYTETNIEKIISIAKDADILFCEATFLDRDRDRARERSHLTAREAGLLAHMAGVRRLEVFHFSPRYQGMEHEIIREAQEAFVNGV